MHKNKHLFTQLIGVYQLSNHAFTILTTLFDLTLLSQLPDQIPIYIIMHAILLQFSSLLCAKRGLAGVTTFLEPIILFTGAEPKILFMKKCQHNMPVPIQQHTESSQENQGERGGEFCIACSEPPDQKNFPTPLAVSTDLLITTINTCHGSSKTSASNETVCGKEKRVRINPKTSLPYNRICSQVIEDTSGIHWVGSGFKIHFLGVNFITVVTCIILLTIYIDRTYARRITITFSCKALVTATCRDLFVTPEYINSAVKNTTMA